MALTGTEITARLAVSANDTLWCLNRTTGDLGNGQGLQRGMFKRDPQPPTADGRQLVWIPVTKGEATTLAALAAEDRLSALASSRSGVDWRTWIDVKP